MRKFTEWELTLICRGLMILHYMLIGRESQKCKELADIFSSDLRVLKEYGDI